MPPGTPGLLQGKELIRLRREIPAFAGPRSEGLEALGVEQANVLFVRRGSDEEEAAAVFHFGDAPVSVALPLPAGPWARRLDSAEERWQGSGSRLPEQLHSDGEVRFTIGPKAFVLFTRATEAEAVPSRGSRLRETGGTERRMRRRML